MKKFMLATLLMLLSTVTGLAQMEDLNFRIGGYVGYNVAESTANYGATLSVSGYYLMGELDVSQNKLSDGESFISLSPLVGFYYGEQIRGYALIGLANWGEYRTDGKASTREETFREDKIYAKLKLGVNFMIGKNFFIDVNWVYIPKDDGRRGGYYNSYRRGPSECKNNSIAVGIGVKF